jgi:hypothetical protein
MAGPTGAISPFNMPARGDKIGIIIKIYRYKDLPINMQKVGPKT